MKKIICLFSGVWMLWHLSAQQTADDRSLLFSPKGIARLHITMLNGKNINDIWHDERRGDNEYYIAPKLEASAELTNSDLSTYSSSELYSGKILIKGRGNTSWHRPRRPYNIDLITDSGEDTPVPLLGMGKDNEWSLITFWEDRSLMRIPLALWLGTKMNGLDFSAQSRYVELWIDDSYRGLYILVEKVQRGDTRINVKSLGSSEEDQIEPRVTGGYILEVVPWDKMKREDENDTKINIPGMEDSYHWYVFKYPKPKNITPEQQNYIFQYLTDFKNTLYGNNYTDPVNGYQKYIDVDAFIDWAILHDLSKGVDNLFHASIFLQKNRNQKLGMTAPWDFDLSFGNVEEQNTCYYEHDFWIRKAHYFNRLWQDKNFENQVKKRFEELMPLFDMVPRVLQANYKQLEQNGVLDRDYNSYGREVLETYKNDKQRDTYVNITTYKGHVQYLKDWFESRKAWLYYNFANDSKERCERMAKVAPTIRVLEPEKLDKNDLTWTTLMPSNGKYSYHWFVDDEHKAIYDGEDYQIKREGVYTVRIVDRETGCESALSRPVGWGVGDDYKPDPPEPPTGVKEIETENIIIFPNPAKDFIFIRGIENEDVMIGIYDVRGVLLMQTNRHFIDVAKLNSGIYLVKISTKIKIMVKKIIIVSE